MYRPSTSTAALAALTLAALAAPAAQAAKAHHPAHGHAKTAHAKIVTTRDGLKYQDLKVGKGPAPRAGQTVTVDYVGTLTNGHKFDASRDHGGTFSFPIGQGQVIKGWDEGVLTMRVGGERKLIIPPSLGYGAAGAGAAVPPNATLIFDVKLLGIH